MPSFKFAREVITSYCRLDHATVTMHQCSIGFVLWSVWSWFKTGKAWSGRPGNGGLWHNTSILKNGFGSIWFWLVTILFYCLVLEFLLYTFHKKLRILWKKSFSFCQTGYPRFSCIVHCYTYRKLTCKNLQVTEFSFPCKSTKKKSLLSALEIFP